MSLYKVIFSLRNPKVISLINICMGILLIFAFLFFVRNIISISTSPDRKTPMPEKKSGPERARHAVPFQDYAPILKNNPFGFPGGELKPIIVSSGEGSSLRTDISLIGTVSGPRSLSYAIFADKTGLQAVFRVGNPVFSLGTLKKVGKDRVFISSSGRDIEIPIAEITTIREIKRPYAGETASTGFARKTGEGVYAVDQKRVQQAIENPSEIMTDAWLLPNIVEGKQEGFVLSEVKAGGIYQSLGLQNGDILLRINEYTISSPEAALQAFTALKGMDRVQLDIIRAGAKMTITYQIK